MTFCYYCQRDYTTLPKLKRHLARVHSGTYADLAFNPERYPAQEPGPAD